ncbi:hypothetical protein SIAM614_10028 [Stappia aggregata IAM 12614]|uniref:Uncharacterized protein n=1 Tax=Roseibium aggregatum (strain ATCC 25650 / DSM 13394 / JCM 20685 / NBRC 16684 / NCIMB 2208 / IAM 12614 / B1) TaxID=384765 RepID=A0NM63_ROSAI|nr:hypothetical protein SIAM614_10028 [Stappia aggregata IAM 12614] [Roseibium aggregatum IAM 12614]
MTNTRAKAFLERIDRCHGLRGFRVPASRNTAVALQPEDRGELHV